MVQAVFALGIVVITAVYAFVSLIKFMIPAKKRKTGKCGDGNCHCGSAGPQKSVKHFRESHFKAVKLG